MLKAISIFLNISLYFQLLFFTISLQFIAPFIQRVNAIPYEDFMRAVVQRVKSASVSVAEKITGEIARGLVVLLGVGRQDTADDVAYMVAKTANLRVFEDDAGLMNLTAADIGGQILVVSQFTLYGDCRKGRRPSFSAAAGPAQARELYELYITGLQAEGLPVASGVFRAMMEIRLVNDGPVTLLLDSSKLF